MLVSYMHGMSVMLVSHTHDTCCDRDCECIIVHVAVTITVAVRVTVVKESGQVTNTCVK